MIRLRAFSSQAQGTQWRCFLDWKWITKTFSPYTTSHTDVMTYPMHCTNHNSIHHCTGVSDVVRAHLKLAERSNWSVWWGYTEEFVLRSSRSYLEHLNNLAKWPKRFTARFSTKCMLSATYNQWAQTQPWETSFQASLPSKTSVIWVNELKTDVTTLCHPPITRNKSKELNQFLQSLLLIFIR